MRGNAAPFGTPLNSFFKKILNSIIFTPGKILIEFEFGLFWKNSGSQLMTGA